MTRKIISLILVAAAFSTRLFAQDTFSIVAADSATKEVGSAGASCVDLIPFSYPYDFISEHLPGVGAINTQAQYDATNQQNARTHLQAGETPAQVIDWLKNNDAGSDASIRQYGIAAFVNGSPKAEAYTGTNCMNTKYHKTGVVNGVAYAIQGNILIGQKVIDSMEAQFLRATGGLKCKLMAALQGANIVGADSRCTGNNSSSLFAFLKVSKVDDVSGSPYIKAGVITADGAQIEPIDSIQKLVSLQYYCAPASIKTSSIHTKIKLSPNPCTNYIQVTLPTPAETIITISDVTGRTMYRSKTYTATINISTSDFTKGMYFITIQQKEGTEVQKMIVR